MRARTALLVAPALLAAGCDGGGETADRTVRSITIENPHHQQLEALSPEMRRLGLMRAIRDSGKRCKRVEAAQFQEHYRGLAMWVALCADERAWGVFIAPTGDIQVRACEEAAQLDLPQCRLPDPETRTADVS